MPTTPAKLPKTLAACADRLYKLKAIKADAKRVVDTIEAEEAQLREYLIDNLPKGEATGIVGKLARATVVVKTVPQVEDWDKLRKYIVKTGSWDILQKRVSSTAIGERWDDDKQVPGVTQFQTATISLNKVG